MKVIKTTDPPPPGRAGDQWQYNGIDTAVPIEIFQALEEHMEDYARKMETFSWRMVPLAMCLSFRGFRVAADVRDRLLAEHRILLADYQRLLDEMGEAVGMPTDINVNAPAKLHVLFYDVLKIPKYWRTEHGVRKLPMDRETLEKIQWHFYARPFAQTIMAIRDVEKSIQVLERGVDGDGRMRFTWNVVGTETGRWSSQKNACGGGGNAQNITDKMRQCFTSDEGKKLGHLDLEQSESRCVAYDSGDERYIEACESGDLHTQVARMVWPSLQWPADPVDQRIFAEQPGFYRHFSRRDMTKRLGHASNYLGSAFELARRLRLEKNIIEEFQNDYFAVFRGIQAWHKEIQRLIQEKLWLENAFGRRRQFFDRVWEESTLKEAVAWKAQSMSVDYLDTALVKAWEEYDLTQSRVQFLTQEHDGTTFQFEEEDREAVKLIDNVFRNMYTDVNGRRMHIPIDLTAGYNWSRMDDDNPGGLVKFDSPEERTQVRPEKETLLNVRL